MQFLLSVHGSVTEGDEYGAYGSAEAMNQAFADTAAFNDRLEQAGQLVFVGGLVPASDARTVDRAGEVVEGPYLPGPERLGGLWVVEVPDAEAALQLAAAGAKACRAKVEVRAFAG